MQLVAEETEGVKLGGDSSWRDGKAGWIPGANG